VAGDAAGRHPNPDADCSRLRQLPHRAHRAAAEREPDAHPEPHLRGIGIRLRIGVSVGISLRLRLRVGQGVRLGEPDPDSHQLSGATPPSRRHAPGDGRPSLSRRRPALTLPPARPRVTRRPHEEAICASRVEIGAPLQTEPGWFPVTLQIPAVIQLALPMISCAT